MPRKLTENLQLLIATETVPTNVGEHITNCDSDENNLNWSKTVCQHVEWHKTVVSWRDGHQWK